MNADYRTPSCSYGHAVDHCCSPHDDATDAHCAVYGDEGAMALHVGWIRCDDGRYHTFRHYRLGLDLGLKGWLPVWVHLSANDGSEAS